MSSDSGNFLNDGRHVDFIDVSDRALIELTGAESLEFLQRISTNDLKELAHRSSISTILTSEKGRIVDLVTVHFVEPKTLLLAGNSTKPEQVVQWLEKYIVMEDIQVKDLTPLLKQILLIGSQVELAREVSESMKPLQCSVIEESDPRWGVRLITDEAAYQKLMSLLSERGCRAASNSDHEAFRIAEGIPSYPQELSANYNPLEVGLWSLVSWTKGCYIGQEVIARLDTYKKVQKSLVQLKIDRVPAEVPIPISVNGVEIGQLTSVAPISQDGSYAALGFIKSQHLEDRSGFSASDGSGRMGIEVLSVVRW